MRNLVALGRLSFLLCAVFLLTACMDDEDEVADQIEGDVIGSPTAAAGNEEDIEEITIAITDGQFDEDGIELTEERATVLRVQNNDDVAYMLQIVPLVNGSPIAASGETAIEFTTPNENEYVCELLPESGGEPLDTISVDVISAAGVTN